MYEYIVNYYVFLIQNENLKKKTNKKNAEELTDNVCILYCFISLLKKKIMFNYWYFIN